MFRAFLDWMLPHGSSTFVDEIDWIYYLILIITGIAFVITEVALIWFLFKYRRRPGVRAYYTHGSNKAEIIWTSITAIAVVMVGLVSAPAWGRIKGRNAAPANSIQLAIMAKQFEWHITYPGPDLVLGNADDFTIRGQVHVPLNKPVAAKLTAEDVIHSFFIPAFRIKQDAVPGMVIPIWFQATETGQFEVACAELCGLGHYRMKAMATVHTEEAYATWMAAESVKRAVR